MKSKIIALQIISLIFTQNCVTEKVLRRAHSGRIHHRVSGIESILYEPGNQAYRSYTIKFIISDIPDSNNLNNCYSLRVFHKCRNAEQFEKAIIQEIPILGGVFFEHEELAFFSGSLNIIHAMRNIPVQIMRNTPLQNSFQSIYATPDGSAIAIKTKTYVAYACFDNRIHSWIYNCKVPDPTLFTVRLLPYPLGDKSMAMIINNSNHIQKLYLVQFRNSAPRYLKNQFFELESISEEKVLHGYYALVPFSFVIDVITYPIQIIHKIMGAIAVLKMMS